MSQSLQTTNPEQLIYENPMLKLTVLGGIKLEGLDRLRVTLKIELKDTSVPAVRHNLDLYNDTQLEKLIRKTADKLEIGTSVIAASLSEITEQLENYRLEELKKQETPQYEAPRLDSQQRQEAENFLKQTNLLEKTNEQIGKSGMVGESTNRLLMYLIFTSRKLNQPLHIISLGASGMGKTHLQEKIGELIPEEDTLSVTSLSENSFYYFGQQELKHKLILIEDLDGVSNALYPLRELQSKKRISKTIPVKNSKGETKTIHLVVEGPVSVAGCTTKEQIYEDNSNRSFLIYLDESQSQTDLIMEYQRRQSAGKIDKMEEEKARILLKNTQRILLPITVKNPYAEALQLPKEVFKPRRSNSHYLQFIEAVTFYNQYQRVEQLDEATGEVFIETTLEDIEEANKLLTETLLRKSDVLTGACRNHFETLKLFLIGQKQKKFTNREISQKMRISLATVKRHHYHLFNAGYLKYEKEEKGRVFYYEIISYKEYEQLHDQVQDVLTSTLEQLKSLVSAQSTNEPSNTKKASKISASAQ